MPTEVQDLLIEGQKQLAADVERVRSQLREDHIGLHRKMTAMSERIAKLEFHNKLLMYLVAPAGVIIGMVARDVIGGWF